MAAKTCGECRVGLQMVRITRCRVAALATVRWSDIRGVTAVAGLSQAVMPFPHRGDMAGAAISRRLLHDGRVTLPAGEAHRRGDIVVASAGFAVMASHTGSVIADIVVALFAVPGDDLGRTVVGVGQPEGMAAAAVAAYRHSRVAIGTLSAGEIVG